MDVFVQPPVVRSFFGRLQQKARDQLIEFRLRNLDAIAAGTRKPHEILRNAKPVAGPEAWR